MISRRPCLVLGAAILGAWSLAGCVIGSEGEVADVAEVVSELEQPVPCQPPTPVPAGCCPGAFELMAECDVVAITDPNFVEGLLAVDQNGDNWYCVLIPPEGNPKFNPFFLAMDNTRITPSHLCQL